MLERWSDYDRENPNESANWVLTEEERVGFQVEVILSYDGILVWPGFKGCVFDERVNICARKVNGVVAKRTGRTWVFVCLDVRRQ